MRTRIGARDAFAACVGLVLALSCGWPGAGSVALAAGEPSGKALAVDPEADALRGGNATMLAPEQPVYMGDRVRTGPRGKAQLEFSDETKLVVGPSSNLLIERYLLKNTNTVKSFSVTALRGTFRFITGDSPKPAYAIKTPTATIGIRGTEFDLTVQPDGSTEMVLLSGAVRVCGGGGCISVGDRCSLIRVPRSGAPSLAGPSERLARIQAAFPYVNNQSALKPDFHASTQGCAPSIEARRDSKVQQVQAAAPQARPPAPPPPPPPTPPAPPACDHPGGRHHDRAGRGVEGGNSEVRGGMSPRGSGMSSPGSGQANGTSQGGGNRDGRRGGRNG